MSKAEADKIMTEADGNIRKLKTLNTNEDYSDLARELSIIDRTIKYNHFGDNGDINRKPNIKSYKYDLLFGLELYKLLTFDNRFKITMREATNAEYWIYLSVVVIPDIVSERWSINDKHRYYNRETRIWLLTLWWYIHLSWQGTFEETEKILKNNSTDTILNLVDRTTLRGYNIELFRVIMREYSKINKNSIKNKKRNIFRTIQVTNTSLIQSIEPTLYKDGVEGYVKKIFNMLNLEEINGIYLERQ